VRLYPLYHPAAALYTPSMVDTLRADFLRIPELLALPEPEQPRALAQPAVPDPELAAEPEPATEDEREPAQLGLF
jgi:DNA polymerase